MRGMRVALIAISCATFVLAAGGTAGAATSAPTLGHLTCNGGSIAPGTYSSITVAGPCQLTNHGTVRVTGGLTVASAGLFDAVTPGTLNVGGNLVIHSGGIAGVGCSPHIGCQVTTADTIGGNLLASAPRALIVHSVAIAGSVNVFGGGGSMNCNATALFGGPYYDDFEDTTVGGWVTVRHVHSCWFGFIRNHVTSNVTISGMRLADPDANEIVSNTIGGNLACYDDTPHPHVGDSQGSPNVVGGSKIAECHAPGL